MDGSSARRMVGPSVRPLPVFFKFQIWTVCVNHQGGPNLTLLNVHCVPVVVAAVIAAVVVVDVARSL